MTHNCNDRSSTLSVRNRRTSIGRQAGQAGKPGGCHEAGEDAFDYRWKFREIPSPSPQHPHRRSVC